MNQTNISKLVKIIFDIPLTRSQRDKIASFLGECEDTGKTCTPEPHRVIRGNSGGKYTLNNIKWLSSEKHKEYHFKELGGRKG